MAKNNETKMITKNSDDDKIYQKREFATKMTFEQMKEYIQRNVSKNSTKSYTQYTKETVKSYLQNPASSLSKIIEISRFLERNSMLYKKIISYFATMPLFYYNIVQENDWSKSINRNKSLKDYYTVTKSFNGFDVQKEMFNAIYCSVRDGMFVGFTYSDDEHHFMMPLDISYCRIYGKNSAGQFIVYFDASFFKSGTNSIFVEGVDGDGVGVWDQVFIDGWNAYQADNNARWFMLPPEKTLCLLSCPDDQFDVPLPYFAPLIISLMDLIDLESIIASKAELENYKLIVSKIPMIKGEDVDDFAISLDLAQMFDLMLENAVPDLVGHVISPMDIDTVEFNKSNNANDTDDLQKSVSNLFNNAGVSQLVVAGGSSTNSIGLNFSIRNDESTCWIFVNRIESWLDYYLKSNISEGYKLYIHHETWYNRQDYITEKKDAATLGGSAMDYLTATGDTPYAAYQKLNWENAVGLKSLMIPLQSSYTASSSDNTGGRPQSDDADLTDEGAATRDGDKNAGTKANK